MESVKNYFKTIGKSFFNSLFERSIRVYIQKHLGEFLHGKLTTDQVDLGLDGGSLASLYLNVEAINERLESVNVPFTLTEGYVDTLHLQIPWSEISTESISVVVDGLLLIIKMKETDTDDGLDVKSMLESMTASMVEEVMKSNIAAADIQKISEAGKGASPFESVELMSEFISSITSRIQVKLQNVTIKTEKSPGVSAELVIDSLEYYDKDSSTSKEKQPNLPPTPKGFTTKVLEISKVAVNFEEVWSRESSPKPMDPVQQSTMAFDIAMSSPPSSGNYMQSSCMTQSIYPGMTSIDVEETSESETGCRIPVMSMDKTQTVTIQIKNDDQLPGPEVDVAWNMESLHVFMSPKLISLASKLLNADSASGSKKAPKQVPMTDEDFEMCRRAAMEEERQRRDSGALDSIDVPPLTMEKHLEMMQGATADSLLSEDDMFFSAYPSANRSSLSTFDVSDSFSSTNASTFSHGKKSKVERSNSRAWDDPTVESQRVNLTIPFFTVTVLLEDPEPCTVIPPSSPGGATSCHYPAPSSSYPPKTSVLQSDLFGPSSLPKSFTGVKPQFTHPVIPISSSTNPEAQSSFKHEKPVDDSDSDDDEEYHDSGDYFESPHFTFPVDADNHSHNKHKSASTPINSKSFPSLHKTDTPLSRPGTAKSDNVTPGSDALSNKLEEVATKFFEEMAKLETRKPLHQLRDKVAALLPLDHLGLIAKPVHVDVSQEKKSFETKQKLKITFGTLEVIECLFDCFNTNSDFAKTALPKLPQYSEKGTDSRRKGSIEIVQLLMFDVNGLSDMNTQYDPRAIFNTDKPRIANSALSLSVDSIQRKRRNKEAPIVSLSFDLGKLTSEVDITIIDRLTNLLNPETSAGSGSNIPTQLVDDNQGNIDEVIKDEQGNGSIQPSIKARAVHATLRVRFPIPDLRVDPPAQTQDWWRRNLHKEILLLEMEAPEVCSSIKPDEPWQLDLQVFKISAYLQEDINTQPILFGEVTVEDKKASQFDENHFNWPRLVVNVSKKSNSALDAEEESDASATSMDSYIDSSLWRKDAGPFSKKTSMHLRDDLSFSEQNPANDEMVMPGDSAELKEFRDKSTNRTMLSVEITAPCVTAFMHSKDFLELLYNRFNNDLLMWEPQPPRARTYMNNVMPSSTNLSVVHMLGYHMEDPPSIADNESESEDDESMHYSIHDRRRGNKTEKCSAPKLLNKMCFSLNIGNGRLLAVIPHVDQENNPGVHAEMMLTVKDGLLFSVNQHGGDPDLKYLCLQVNRAQLYHNSCLVLPVQQGTLDHMREKLPSYLSKRIHRSDRWVSDKAQGVAGWGPDTPDMLTLVVKTKMDSLNNVKNFTVALRVDGATLQHEMHRSGESWISQAMELLDLKDFPILGYTMPKIMTELHLQIDHCCVDYRPLHLPVWSFLTVEHFSVCTNIIAESAFSQIRLHLDDSALFLSKKCNKEVNLLRDYVCVAEMDQFKIWLQFCYDKSGKQHRGTPRSDLRFMVNELNIRTCADSARALLDLIQYIVTDGDLTEKPDRDDVTPTGAEDSHQFFPGEEAAGERQPSPVLPVPAITPEQEASVMSALEEAMTECPETYDQVPARAKKGKGQVTQVFFQCDSPNRSTSLNPDLEGAMHITVSDSSDTSTPEEDGGDHTDSGEEFEMVECYFREPRNIKGTHEVYALNDGCADAIDNFISKPTSSFDHLKAPDYHPEPEYQYTLREVSILWQVYGGSDFSQPRRGSSSERIGSKAHQSPRDQRRLSESGGKHVWRRRGGDWRDFDVLMELDLNKIRFRYEVYPINTKESSRFKLLVNNVELRDRIKTSDVNKFLVKLVDKEHPEQSSVYMLMFSGVFTRPEHLPFREECEVKAFCLPIKLNVDQVSLSFMHKFVTQLADPEPEIASASGGRSSPLGGRASPMGGRSSPRPSLSSTEPIMRVGDLGSKESSMDRNELLMKFEDFSNQQSLYLQARLEEDESLQEDESLERPQEDLPVFIKSFVLISDITIKLDYRGKQCDMASGVMNVMLGFASLTGSIIKLKRLSCQKGILGWDKLLMYVANEWLKDIRSNQIHSILKGVGSLSIICQIFQGLTDLVRLPIEQYQRDRRIMRGLQRGANSFTLNTIMAILELTNKVVGSIQYCAELGYDMMSPGPSVRRRKQQHRHRNRQPRTTAEGAKAALQLMTDGVKESASHLSAIVSEESAHKGYVGLVGGTLRNATPECLFKPLALLAEAGTNIVQGARNEVDPSVMKEEEDRWKQT